MRKAMRAKKATPERAYETKKGRMYCGNSEELLAKDPLTRRRGKVQMIFTSPPFPLNRKKKYGNLQGDEYVEWFARFAPLFKEYLTPNGSIVVELGNSWEKGKPAMSTLPLKALLAFQERACLNLCQEFICFNTAKLPTPAQWVNVERCRIKDAFTRVWWMSHTDRPKADNRRVLTKYSDSMRQLLKRGTYNAGARPSEHNIGAKSFLTDNEGAIPPNVLIPPMEEALPDLVEVLPIANTRSNDRYQRHCRKHSLEFHPARMPARLIEFFVEFLTDPGDLILDPFAGSNSTGSVAERLGRRWLSIEANMTYVQGSRGRFSRLS